MAKNTEEHIENAYPELLIIPSEVEWKNWFISFEEGDGFNTVLNVYLRIGVLDQRVTVRYLYHYRGDFDSSIREALLGVGECVEIEAMVEACDEALNGSEKADVSVKFPGWKATSTPGRRLAPKPWA